MREPICCGPRRGLCHCTRRTMVADSDVGDLLPRIVALLDLHVGSDECLMLELAGSASCPVVAGVAYRSLLADGASLSLQDEGVRHHVPLSRMWHADPYLRVAHPCYPWVRGFSYQEYVKRFLTTSCSVEELVSCLL